MKKKTAENAFAPDSNDLNREGGINIPESEFPAPLIYKLSEFYRRWPDYPTGIVEIAILARILHTEMDKFLHRPHKQVPQIYFDSDAADKHLV